MLKKITYLLFILNLSFVGLSSAQNGYEINVNIEGFQYDTLLLGYQYADKQYIKDTVLRTEQGFTFKGEETLDCGMYLIILPPENRYFQFLIDDQDQQFSLTTSEANPVIDIEFQGSEENDLFYSYLKFISKQTPIAQKLNEQIKEAKTANKKYDNLQSQLEKVNNEVKEFQLKVMEDHPTSLTARVIKSSREIDVPEFDMDTDQGKRERYRYLRAHWLDNLNLSDPCLIRTSLLNDKVMTYLDKLTPQIPDTINTAVDYIIEKASGNEKTKQNWLSALLNKYANSKIIGMDGVYVHMVMKYYAKGHTPWVDEEKILEMVDNATKLEPLLIGKIAPEIVVPKLDIEGTIAKAAVEEDVHKKFVLGEKISLHQLDSPFKVLFIWAPDCGHCKKSMPNMIDFYDKFESRGVKMYAICHQTYKETPACADFIVERPGMLKWINLTDPYFRSKYQTLYNVKSTPQIYILNEKNEILIKRIDSKQIESIMEELISRSNNKNK